MEQASKGQTIAQQMILKIAIAGRAENTENYVRYVKSAGAVPAVTLEQAEIAGCGGLLLPGGGDIAPAFYGEQNRGSADIDTELDILQLQAFDLALQRGMPILGICKGLQLINVGFHGTLLQDLGTAGNERHRYENGDRYHTSAIEKGSWLYRLYGGETTVNSAHHQAISRLGEGLSAVSRCPLDGCIEAIAHRSLPVTGVQWHPERIDAAKSGTDGRKVLEHFISQIRRAAIRP